MPIRVTSYDSESIKASSIFTATGSLDQAFAFPYEGFALGVAVVASTTPTAPQSTSISTTSSDTASSQPESMASNRNTGVIAGTIIGSIAAALLLTGLVVFMINYRRKRMSGNQIGQFPDYACHLRLASSSPTPMIYLSQPPKVMTEYSKENDKDQSSRYAGQRAFNELEAKSVYVYELDGGARLPTTKTKKLPDLPPPNKNDV